MFRVGLFQALVLQFCSTLLTVMGVFGLVWLGVFSRDGW